jgi:indoleacetamide hydrolase
VQQTRFDTCGQSHELGLAAAACAIRNGDVSSETYVGRLLERVREQGDLKAFITIDEASVLQAATQAGGDRDVLVLARAVELVIGPVPGPAGF